MNAILALNAALDAPARAAYRTPSEVRALYARLATLSHTVRTIAGQAEALGLEEHEVYLFRTKAKLAGYDVQPVQQRRKEAGKRDRLAEIDAEMSGPGCTVCTLHGAHTCTTESRDELATSRPGSSYAPPTLADGDDEAPPTPRRESLNNACIRHRLERQTLVRLLEAAGVERPGRAKTKWFLDPGEVDRVVGAWRAAPVVVKGRVRARRGKAGA